MSVWGVSLIWQISPIYDGFVIVVFLNFTECVYIYIYICCLSDVCYVFICFGAGVHLKEFLMKLYTGWCYRGVFSMEL